MALIYHLLDERSRFSEHDGGAISRWAANVLRAGSEIIICPSYDSSWAFPEDRLFQLPHWSSIGPIHPIVYRLPWALQKAVYLRLFKPLLERVGTDDIIYVHNRPACAAVLATVADHYGFRVVLHMHNSHLIRSNRGQLEALRKVPIVYCSDFLRREADAALPNHFEKSYLVYNGADGDKFAPVKARDSSTATVIFTGRLVTYKGVHVLLDAMRILEKQGLDVNCQVVGGSAFGNSRVTRYIRKLERSKPNNTELLGYKSGKALSDLVQKASIFCCPSIWNDPFPLAPLEAMAAGLPVVASNVGGLPEALAHGGGVLVPPNNAKELAEALGKLVQDNEHRKQLGQQARSVFQTHFLWKSVREQYLAAIEGMSS